MRVHLENKKIRIAAFGWLDEQVRHYDDVLPRSLLTQGFELEGQRVPLVSRQGIFKPKVLRMKYQYQLQPVHPVVRMMTR